MGLFFCEFRQNRELLEIFLNRPGRSAPEHDPLPAQNFVGGNAGLGADNHALADADSIRDSDLASENRVFLDDYAARDASLRGDHDILANLAVVADVHEVVDLRPAANARKVERAAVDRGIGADFDVIFNFQAADLGEFFVAAGRAVAHIAKAVAAKHGSGVNEHAIAKLCARVDRDVGIKSRSEYRFVHSLQ